VIQVGKPELRFRLLRPRGSSRSVFAHRAAASNAAAQGRTGHAGTGRALYVNLPVAGMVLVCIAALYGIQHGSYLGQETR